MSSFSYDYSQSPKRKKRRFRRRHPIASAVIFVVVIGIRVALGLSGHDGHHINRSQLEADIVRTSAGQALTAQCPSSVGDIAFSEKTTFRCTVQLSNGTTGSVTINWDDGKYSVDDFSQSTSS